MIRRELHIFLTAVMFYTRIPCPAWVDHAPTYITLCTRYFPVIGMMVGSIYAMAIVGLSFVFTPLTAVLIALGISILLTGSFHEDGLADTCDGFGGGWTRDRILTIMKDSRLGTYGTIGLLLTLAIKVSLTVDLLSIHRPTLLIILLVTSHTLSRMMAIILIYTQGYAKQVDNSADAKPVATGLKTKDFIIAVGFTTVILMAYIYFTQGYMVIILLPMLGVTFYLRYYFQKWINGHTGDCLGATQQLNELVFLAAHYALWHYIS
jgi:adenosylcobinamide-GDP ribazoletransferase